MKNLKPTLLLKVTFDAYRQTKKQKPLQVVVCSSLKQRNYLKGPENRWGPIFTTFHLVSVFSFIRAVQSTKRNSAEFRRPSETSYPYWKVKKPMNNLFPRVSLLRLPCHSKNENTVLPLPPNIYFQTAGSCKVHLLLTGASGLFRTGLTLTQD